MKTLFFAVSLLGLGLSGWVHGAEPTNELTEDLAKRLIGEVLEIRSAGISVATLVEGGKRTRDGFVETQVRRVTAVHPVLMDGRMVRRVRCYDFSWSQKYGWFYQETRTSRSGEEVRIWSETKGESVVK